MESQNSGFLGPSKLLQLPAEILLLILGNFCQHCRTRDNEEEQEREKITAIWNCSDRQTLYSACFVSRKFRDLAHPVLYHDCIIGNGQLDDTSARRFTSFLRTVTRQPGLAALVRTCRIAHKAFSYVTESEAEATLEAARALFVPLAGLVDAFQDQWSALGISPSGATTTMLRVLPSQAVADFLRVLLLASLPNLASLYGSYLTSIAIPAEALRAAGITELRMRTVNFLDCRGYFDRRHAYSDNRYFLDGILEMASSTLRTVTLVYTEGILHGVQRAYTNLRNVRIQWVEHTKSDMESFLCRCTAGLEEFTYRGAYDQHSAVVEDPFLTTHAVSLLKGHKSTLKTLRLDIITPHGGLLMPSLKSFPVLEKLSINSDLLSHFDTSEVDDGASEDTIITLLPQSLVSLRVLLFDDDDICLGGRISLWKYAALDSCLCFLLSAVWDGFFPKLREISYDGLNFSCKGLDGAHALFARTGFTASYKSCVDRTVARRATGLSVASFRTTWTRQTGDEGHI